MYYSVLRGDDFDSPLLMLFGCNIDREGKTMRAEFGFINMGLSNRSYVLKDSDNCAVACVKIPSDAVRLPIDFFGCLSNEEFEVV